MQAFSVELEAATVTPPKGAPLSSSLCDYVRSPPDSQAAAPRRLRRLEGGARRQVSGAGHRFAWLPIRFWRLCFGAAASTKVGLARQLWSPKTEGHPCNVHGHAASRAAAADAEQRMSRNAACWHTVLCTRVREEPLCACGVRLESLLEMRRPASGVHLSWRRTPLLRLWTRGRGPSLCHWP
eukprot:358859-Chlamydomonas_euryale.AAC.14